MNFTAKDVQALREKTGAGMMDCKKALTETDGDMDKAVDVLREKGLASAAKKAGRVAAEGVVVAYYDEANKVASMVEVNCETDFVAKNEKFVELANKIAVTVAEKNPADVDALLAMTLSGSDETVSDAVQELFLVIRENMKVRRFVRVEGTVASYIHGGGRIGVLIELACENEAEELVELGKNIAMQIAALNPKFITENDVPADFIAKETEILTVQAKNDPKNAKKPDNIIEKMIAGRLKKELKEFCLVEQPYVKDTDMTVKQYIDSVAKVVGAPIEITRYVRFETGEGMEKKDENFAEEVAKAAKG